MEGGGAARGTRGVPKPPGAPKRLPGQPGQPPAPGSPQYLPGARAGARAHDAHVDGGMQPIPGVLDPQLPPAFSSTTEAPPAPPAVTCAGTGCPHGPHAPGQAALSTGAGRQTAAGGTGTRRRWPERSPGAQCPRGEQQSLVFPTQGQEPLFIAAPFSPASSCP